MKYDIEIDEYGTKRYYVNEKLHREDGPAEEYPNGDKLWYKNGYLHREDGPAAEFSDGEKIGIKMEKFIEKMVQLFNILMDINVGI